MLSLSSVIREKLSVFLATINPSPHALEYIISYSQEFL